MVRLHPHARERMDERGATEEEVRATVEQGESFPAKFGLINTGTADIITPNRLKPMRSKRDLIGWSLPCSHAIFDRLGRSTRREIHL